MRNNPSAVVCGPGGEICDWHGLVAAGRSGCEIHSLDDRLLIPLPEGSRLYFLPGRPAVGFNKSGKLELPGTGYTAVAAFLPPGYVALSLAAFNREGKAPLLPLYCYCAVCWYKGGFHVPAIRVDHDIKHDPSCFDMKKVYRAINCWLRKYPGNRLVRHHGMVCVREYGCPNAANLFLGRWEAPIAVSGGCNASCQGCISRQNLKMIQSPQVRISFVPTVKEIVEIAVPHLGKAPGAMISFGQGCEGEPLLQGNLIESAIREIRRRTKRGTIHINTNGSMPDVVERLAAAGLDSIRISLNSARPELYSAYYRCRKYSFDDVMESFRIAGKAGLWVSVNYLTFPGVTDDKAELAAFEKLLRTFKPKMIQWRNLNIDPDWYMQTVERAVPSKYPNHIGIPALMKEIRKKFPVIRFGYFNPPV
ncbi:MAG: radical SAM protein [Kiritimatiellae bacterium]|nr:radical SAM protein [Kiritimatiellia bacterium]MDD5521854.1 radical SAM protein [Kiritimatiellia bacterium]